MVSARLPPLDPHLETAPVDEQPAEIPIAGATLFIRDHERVRVAAAGLLSAVYAVCIGALAVHRAPEARHRNVPMYETGLVTFADYEGLKFTA